MKKENIQNFLTDYAYKVNDEISCINRELKIAQSESYPTKSKASLYKRLHETEGIIEAIDNFRTYVNRYPDVVWDYNETLNNAKNYAHDAMSKLGAKNINEEVKQAIIDVYIKGIQE